MPRPLDELLKIHIGSTESLLRLIPRCAKRRRKFFLVPDDAHPASTTARRSFHNNGILDSRRFRECLGFIGNNTRRAGDDRHSRRGHFTTRLVFLAHHPQQFGRRTDKCNVRRLAHFRKVGVLREKAVARMYRIDVSNFRGADYLRDVQVTLTRPRRPDADGFIGEAHVQRIPVRFGVNRDGGDSQFLARINHAQGDFTTIGNEDFSKHLRPVIPRWRFSYFLLPVGRNANSGSPYSTGCPFSTMMRATSPLLSASISFINFMASIIHTVWPAWTVSPTFTKGPDSGLGPRRMCR